MTLTKCGCDWPGYSTHKQIVSHSFDSFLSLSRDSRTLSRWRPPSQLATDPLLVLAGVLLPFIMSTENSGIRESCGRDSLAGCDSARCRDINATASCRGIAVCHDSASSPIALTPPAPMTSLAGATSPAAMASLAAELPWHRQQPSCITSSAVVTLNLPWHCHLP